MNLSRYAGEGHISNTDSLDRKTTCVGVVSGSRHHGAMKGALGGYVWHDFVMIYPALW